MSESNLLAFHIGPIQDFIATARRTQDLWMGSWLLSHLSRVAIEKAQDLGAKLVLPKEIAKPGDANFDPAIADVPNHFTARYEGSDPEEVASNVENAVRTRWKEIADAVRNVFFNTSSGQVDSKLWNRQVENFLEIYWVVVPDDGSLAARKHAQAVLEARKRLRDFRPVCEPHLKCTLCGVRQELSGKKESKQARQWWTVVVKSHNNRGHLLKLRAREDGSERLCAVCTIKRAAVASQKALPQLQKTNGSFPSTSSVAAAMFKKRVIESVEAGKAQHELADYLERLKDAGFSPEKIEKDCVTKLWQMVQGIQGNARNLCESLLTFDGDLFYTETLTMREIEKEYPEAWETLCRKAEDKAAKDLGVSSATQARQVSGGGFDTMVRENVAQEIAATVDSLRTLYRRVNARPSKYFAALMMDGDHMGAYYGKMPEQAAQAMSGQMSQFARTQAKEVVEKHFGRLVYAGGDDVLALLPLETALSCARDLQEKFKKAVEDALEGVVLPADMKRPTPSIGIAIAHHTQPFDAMLTAMREAEKDAKNKYGRNALCVYVLKRSGEEVHVGAQWQAGGEDSVTVVTELIDLLNQKALSMKFPMVFADEARFLPTDAIEAELGRVARRQKGERFDEMHEKRMQTWLTEAAKLAKAIGAEEFAQWSLLARFIVSGGRDQE